ncbi:M16 family metallopeptidase [Motilimonas pumila]|uniref:Insulinase family protein n=1 Tax=Motilimonas pumila TaxID=2303987 RepID=A0A418YEY4_9GAMM|nr:insulinase family protein [Motilimonas pumila]RJG47756.1 insulinase family protein [Motilimonas pumila]
MKKRSWMMVPLFLVATLLFACNKNDELLVNDPNWFQGELETGLRYHVYPMQDTNKRTQVYLYVGVGAMDETEQQQGYAHLLEHMAFNGTQHFPGHEIAALFRQAGLNFGNDLNAWTSHKATVYTLSIPDNQPELLDKVMLYLADVSYRMTLDEAEVAKEKGVVRGEYHQRIKQEKDIVSAFMENFAGDTGYTLARILGTQESINGADKAGLDEFYRAWYQPQNVQLLVVGDVKPKQVTASVKQHFKDFKQTAKLPKRSHPEPPPFSTESVAFSSKRILKHSVSLNFDLGGAPVKVQGDVKQLFFKNFVNFAVSQRLERVNEDSGHFLFASSYLGAPDFVSQRQLLSTSTEHRLGETNKALAFLSSEMARLGQHGITREEFIELKQTFGKSVTSFEQPLDSETIVNSAIDGLIHGTKFVSSAQMKPMFLDFLQELELDKVNAYLHQVVQTPQLSISFVNVAPVPLKKYEQLMKEQITALQSPYQYQPKAPRQLLLATLPEAVAPQMTLAMPEIKAEKVTYGNGVEVILKPNVGENGDVAIRWSAPGGIRSLAPQLLTAAVLLGDIYSKAEVDGVSPAQRERMFIDHLTSMYPFIGVTQQGFNLETKAEQMAFALSAINASATKAILPLDHFEQVKGIETTNMRSYLNRADGQLRHENNRVLFPNNPYEQLLPLSHLSRLSPSQAEQVYQQLFNSPNGYKLTIVGDFDSEKVKPLLDQFIGSMPKGELHTFTTKQSDYLKGKQAYTRQGNLEDRANLTIRFLSAAQQPSLKGIYAADLIGRLLRQSLNTQIREELSMTYDVNAYCHHDESGKNYTLCGISLITAKQDGEKAMQALHAELSKIVEAGISQTQLAMHKKALHQDMQESFEQPGSLANFLQRDLIYGFEVGAVLDSQGILNQIDTDYINQYLQQRFTDAGQLSLVNLPQDSK